MGLPPRTDEAARTCIPSPDKGIIYDPFQQEAIRHILNGHSVIVAAPTGAGKTAIAEFVMSHCLEQGKGVIYTAPIKALSNQKFRDFQEGFPDRVGILTGDVSLNPDAPLLIMTTEIFHNQILEGQTDFNRYAWIIFDEIHYLDDSERGTVWEESLIFLPPHMKLLGLSATIPNGDDLVGWLRSIHPFPLHLVREEHRPVPLHFFFQCQGRILDNIEQVQRLGFGRSRYGRKQPVAPNRVPALLTHLLETRRLPCLYFAFSRKRCGMLANSIQHLNFLNAEEGLRMGEMYRRLCAQFDLEGESSAEALRPLVERGIAYHHAGLRPTLKEVIERLFTSGLIKVIFTTETFALGINMPARTVAFDDLRKTYGRFHSALRTRDFFQMAGRAGRRGIDSEGFAYLRLNPHDVTWTELKRILNSSFEPVQSQFKPSYATLLNLYEKHGERLYDMYPLSFHYFQEQKKGQSRAVDEMRRRIALLKRLGFIDRRGLTPKGQFAKGIFGYELPVAELFEKSILDRLSPQELAILSLALVYEPRPRAEAPELKGHARQLMRLTRGIIAPVLSLEKRMGVSSPSKALFFHLSETMEAWMKGCSLEESMLRTAADEGEVIRYFRMTVQILHELLDAAPSREFSQTVKTSLLLVNRGIVNAEEQMQASLEADRNFQAQS